MAFDAVLLKKALEEIETQKGISEEQVLAALKEALVRAYRKQIGGYEKPSEDGRIQKTDNIYVNLDIDRGIIELYQVRDVVNEDDIDDDLLQVSVEEANEIDPGKNYKVGDKLTTYASFDELKKATALSVKSIMKQKFAEAEKAILYEAYKDKINTMMVGKVERVDDKAGISVNLGRTSVYLRREQLIGDEKFTVGESVKVYISSVEAGTKGAAIRATRSDGDFLKCLFEEEISEVFDGTITIKKIAREAGERSKVAVYSSDPNVDPAGACIGANGSRIQKIVGQLGNGSTKEKIDIISWSNNAGLYIMESLKPARVVGVHIDKEPTGEGKEMQGEATAIVKDDSLSLAIGRKGVNVRLASRLTNYNIDIMIESEAMEEGIEFQSFEELSLAAQEERARAIEEKQKEQVSAADSILPGMPEGYVAPQERVYDDDLSGSDLNEALEREADKPAARAPRTYHEETPVNETEEAPVVEETVIPATAPAAENSEAPVAPVKKEEKPVVEEVHRDVKTTTSLADLEKSLEEDSKKSQKPAYKKNWKKAHKEDEEEEKSTVASPDNATRMSIYTEEELKAIEEEEKEEKESGEDDVDYDEYDEYYDDDNR